MPTHYLFNLKKKKHQINATSRLLAQPWMNLQKSRSNFLLKKKNVKKYFDS